MNQNDPYQHVKMRMWHVIYFFNELASNTILDILSCQEHHPKSEDLKAWGLRRHGWTRRRSAVFYHSQWILAHNVCFRNIDMSVLPSCVWVVVCLSYFMVHLIFSKFIRFSSLILHRRCVENHRDCLLDSLISLLQSSSVPYDHSHWVKQKDETVRIKSRWINIPEFALPSPWTSSQTFPLPQSPPTQHHEITWTHAQ